MKTAFRCFILLVIVLCILSPQIYIPIKENQAGVLWKRFKQGTVLNQTFNKPTWIFPWDKLYIYDTALQEHRGSLQVIDKAGQIQMISYRFAWQVSLNSLPLLHKSAGPNYAETICIYEAEAHIRQWAKAVLSSEVQSTPFILPLVDLNNELVIFKSLIVENLSPVSIP